MYLGCFLGCFYFFPMVSQSDLFLNPYFLFLYLFPLEHFPDSGLFYPTSSLLYLLPLEFFPYSKLFYPTSHPQMRKFPNSSKILHKWFVLTNFLRYNNHGN